MGAEKLEVLTSLDPLIMLPLMQPRMLLTLIVAAVRSQLIFSLLPTQPSPNFPPGAGERRQQSKCEETALRHLHEIIDKDIKQDKSLQSPAVPHLLSASRKMNVSFCTPGNLSRLWATQRSISDRSKYTKCRENTSPPFWENLQDYLPRRAVVT